MPDAVQMWRDRSEPALSQGEVADVQAFLEAGRMREPCRGCSFTNSVMFLDSKLDSDSHLTDSNAAHPRHREFLENKILGDKWGPSECQPPLTPLRGKCLAWQKLGETCLSLSAVMTAFSLVTNSALKLVCLSMAGYFWSCVILV